MMKEKKKFTYVAPFCEVITVSNECSILAVSPGVGTTPTVENPTEDPNDTELSGAKQYNMWAE